MIQERDIVNDLLKDARFLVTCESFCSVESSPQIKGTFLDVIREDQDQHTRLFQFALSKGWYSTLWGDIGYQQPAPTFAGVQPYAAPGVAQPYAGPATVQPYAAPGATAAQVQPGAWLQPPAQPAWQQPAGVAPMAAAASVSPLAATAGGFRQGNTGRIEVAGREYGPY